MCRHSNLSLCTDESCTDSRVQEVVKIATSVAKKAQLPYPHYEDVVSEVVVSVLSILERGVFRGESAFETYVHAIAKRKVIDVLREKYSRVSPKDLDGLLNIPPPPPFYTVYWREQRRLIVECLEQVNKMDRKVFELHYFHELTYKDIGKSLGFSSRWACIRGRRALRKVLQLFGERARECSRKSGVN